MVASQTGQTVLGSRTYVNYGAAKAAVITYTKNLIADVVSHGITVNSVTPG